MDANQWFLYDGKSMVSLIVNQWFLYDGEWFILSLNE